MTPTINLRKHYWKVSGDEAQVWSSASAAYVPLDDAGYLAFLESGGLPTPIRNEFELQETLLRNAPNGAMSRTFSPAEALAALLIIDEAAVLAAFGAESPEAIVPDAGTLTALCGQLGLAAVSIV